MKITTFVLCCLAIIVNNVSAGWMTTNGKEKEDWEGGYYSIIIARIQGIKKTEEIGVYKAVIIPKATVAGVLDPSVHPTIPVTFEVHLPELPGGITSIRQVPPEGATVLAVLEYLPINDHDEARVYRITPNICTFMPAQSGMVVIKGLDDPKVSETLKKIQRARAEAQAEQGKKDGATPGK
jgi:hypothetical protein